MNKKIISCLGVLAAQYVVACVVLYLSSSFSSGEWQDPLAQGVRWRLLVAVFGWAIASTAYFLAIEAKWWIRWGLSLVLQLIVPWVVFLLFYLV